MIKTKRCLIKKFEEEHIDFYHKLVTDRNVRKYLGGIPSESHIRRSISNFINSTMNDYWVVQELKSEELIGFVSIDKSEKYEKNEISYEFLPKWWGQGYAKEVISEIIRYAFMKKNLDELIAITQSKNVKSRKLLDKVGMKRQTTEIMFGEEQSIYQIKK